MTTLPIENGEASISVEIDNPRGCFNKEEVCVQVGSAPIVANNIHDVRGAAWSDCLPQNSFDIVGSRLYVPAQYKTAYKIRVSTYIHEYRSVSGCVSQVGGSCAETGIVRYEDVRTDQPNPFDSTCYFDTRIQPISGTGTNCSRSLASIADNENVCDTVYPEVRSLMNPRISQILQPFHEDGECFPVRCANGEIVELCGCDATGKGVVLDSLDSLDRSIDYIDYSNSSRDRVNGESKYLADCSRGNVIFFDPPSGGSVTLDAPGEDFILPDYPVTLVIRGADLRIKDNLIYPDGSEASLGVILLENDICGTEFGGDALLHPDPTNVVGAYYLEGSVKSTDANWNLPTDRSSTLWYQTFKNQILWEGTILSLNSIGGAVNPNWPAEGDPNCALSDWPTEIGGGLVDPPWDRAVELDLAYLREYFKCGNLTSNLSNYNYKISGCDSSFDEIVYDELPLPESADGTDAEEAVVLRYDSRIQNNPPPGFDGLADILQSELGL